MESRAIVALWCFCFLAAAALAADNTGAIVGTVRDASGAVIPRVSVTVRNSATNALRQTVTNENGEYAVPQLPAAAYTLLFEHVGFRQAALSAIKLDVDQVMRIDPVLEVGVDTEQVTVSADAALVQRDTSVSGQVVSRGTVTNLPLNERNFINFTLLVPGAFVPTEGSQNSTQGGSVNVNGAREQANNFLLDGTDNNDQYINRYTVLPSVDALQEFKVQSSTSSADYGRDAGAQINVVLKSGENAFHGSGYEYFRNREFDAKNYFDLPGCTSSSIPGSCGPIPGFQRSQFGGTFGGPIVKNRTFFFLSFEELKLRQASTRQSTVPSQADLAAAYAVIPPPFANPAGLAALQLYPAANVGADLNTSTTYTAAPDIRTTTYEASAKLDHQIGPGDFLSGHYAASNQNTFNPYDPGFSVTNLPGYGTNVFYRGQNIGAQWLHILTPRATNSLRFGFNRDHLAFSQQNQFINQSAALGFPAPVNPLDYGFPYIQVTGFDSLGEPDTAPENSVINTVQLSDDFSWSPDWNSGKHNFKFGGEYRQVRDSGYFALYTRGQWLFTGIATGNSLTDLLLGAPQATLFGQGSPSAQMRTSSWNFYGLDDLRLTPRLTLNLGLRYEYNTPIVEAHNQFSVPQLSSTPIFCAPMPNCLYLPAGMNGVPRSGYNSGSRDLEPRIGLELRPFNSERFVVRSAYGMFYDVNITAASEFLHDNPPFFNFGYYFNSGTNVIQNILSSPANLTVASTFPSHFPDSYLQQWNLNFQYGFTPNLALEIGYYGSSGTHLIGFRDLDQSAVGGLPPYPNYALVLSQDKDRSSNYNSLQVRVEKRMSGGLSLLGAFTWSKSIDNGSEWIGSAAETLLPQNSYDLAAERSLSSFNTKDRGVLSFIDRLPFGQGRRWLNQTGVLSRIVSGWQISSIIEAQTGQPFTVNRAGFQSNTTLDPGADRPDEIANPFTPGPVMSNPDPTCHSTISQGGRAADAVHTTASWFNACAFSDPNLLGEFRFGTAPRNSVIGPSLVDVDFTLMRNFQFGERQSLQAQAQVFNIFNHPNFDVPVRIFDSSNFAALDSSNAYGNRPPRQIQIALRYSF
ncbi:MAG TPA: TonB-dependent receptor [Candidatus Binatia bacterium]|nr:TonB-dependent receptor [Candidatus Binatia bacterium]